MKFYKETINIIASNMPLINLADKANFVNT